MRAKPVGGLCTARADRPGQQEWHGRTLMRIRSAASSSDLRVSSRGPLRMAISRASRSVIIGNQASDGSVSRTMVMISGGRAIDETSGPSKLSTACARRVTKVKRRRSVIAHSSTLQPAFDQSASPLQVGNLPRDRGQVVLESRQKGFKRV